MKKFKKSIAIAVLASIILSNVSLASAEWTHTTDRLHHWFPLMMSKEERNANKDKQLCKIDTSFDILNKDWTVKYTYYPQWCQPTESEQTSIFNSIDKTWEDYNKADGFILDIFWNDLKQDSEYMENTGSLDTTDTTWLDFVDDIFTDWNWWEENIEFNSASEEPIDNTDSGSTDESTQDADELLKDIFWKTNLDSNLSLKSSKFVKTIKDYSKNKIRIRVGNIEANVISDDMDYNIKVAQFLAKVDKDFNINSFKNDFAKKVSNVSYSYSTYNNTTDEETKKVFRAKLVNDIKKLKKSYKILKKKDRIISKFFRI